jgi:hypothetical protein
MSLEELQRKERLKIETSHILLANIKQRLPELEKILERVNAHWALEDAFYRFYHGSFKTYSIQTHTTTIVDVLKTLLPEAELNQDFLRIIQEGTGKQFQMGHNNRWYEETRPMLEAIFHAKTMLELTIKYGKELDDAPNLMPSGWAALLYLYNLR